jgi:four helix bundle protein
MRDKLNNLRVYKDALELGRNCLRFGQTLREVQSYALANQLEKSAISIASNISEGASWGSDRVYVKHIQIAIGSAHELLTQLELSRVIVPNAEVQKLEEQIDQIIGQLYGLKRYLLSEINCKK